MIKKIIKLYWHEATDTTQEHRTFKKSFARWRRHGFAGMKSRLEKEYRLLKEDFIIDMGLNICMLINSVSMPVIPHLCFPAF